MKRIDTSMRSFRRLEGRTVSELIGLCRGVLADGHVNTEEAAFVQDWIARNERFASSYPFDVLYRRLAAALHDGVLDEDEESDLLEALVQFVGGETFDAHSAAASMSSALPLCDPPPEIVHLARRFVVTGTFDFGSRTDVINEISARGGDVQKNVVKATNYLLVGNVASRDWAHSSYGRKIESAMQYRADGIPIGIVGETHWTQFLTGAHLQ